MWQQRVFHRLLAFALVLQLLHSARANPINVRSGEVALEFIILHNNDMHARFEQTSADSTKCSDEDAKANRCYGGFARVAYEVRKYRAEAENGGTQVLYLNAGDTYTGTPWFTVFKDNITAAFLNKLQPDAISLGNHEFDENVAGLVPFLNEVEFPVLAANLDLSDAPEMLETKHFANSTILTVGGVKVGIIGYLTPETKFLVVPNTVEFKDEIVCINEEAAKMKAEGINVIIALGHSGYHRDQEIAAGCPDVDIVIGGHTNTFLYNGDQPDSERIDGPYPTVVTQSTGKQVPVVQAYAYTKYLGKLHVQFDKAGNLLEFDGTPILLNADVPAEDDVLQLLEVYRPNITALENSVVGYTKVYLEGSNEHCRQIECNLGNLIADAYVHARVLEDLGGAYWTDAPIAFIQGGGIRSSIPKRSDGSITEDDVVTTLNHNNNLYVTKLRGSTIRQALEHSATLRPLDSNGGFLQMSGLRVTLDYNKPEGARVVNAEARCADCDVPVYSALDDDKFYNVIVTEFMLEGGDGHVFREADVSEPQIMKKNENDAFIQYVNQRDYVYPELEGRITIIEAVADDDNDDDGATTLAGTSLFVMMIAVFVTRLFN